MKHFTPLAWLFAMIFVVQVSAQPGYTADDLVTPYTGQYRTGMNMGYFPGWDNYKLADIAAGNPAVSQKGVGARTLRFSTPEDILDLYGYGLLVPEMAHYKSLNTSEHTAIVWKPKGVHQDITEYCPGKPSALFSNMYLPIWDGGANGTPYNDDNYLAAYLFKTVSTYKDDVKFWEIWNEPGLDLRYDIGGIGWRDQNFPGNWWAEGPAPCDYILNAPIYHYIRVLRVSWEVIKTVDPDAYVCLGSVGYQSMLNAICNNTDNPNMGDVSAAFPKTGAAYFDAVSFHSYPHFDGATTNFSNNFFERHSDQAADGVITYRQLYQQILDQYGYNGVSKPRKEWIITEINSPRQAFGSPFGPASGKYFGGFDAQINHMMKALMISKVSGIHQTHMYELFDRTTPANAGYEFDQMGMYKFLNGASAYDISINDLGMAVKTTSDFLNNSTYDALRTAQMSLPTNLRGYAFKRTDGTYVYAVWARTTEDLSEAATGTYSFPATFNLAQVERYDWNAGYTNQSTTVSGSNINLNARPQFFTATGAVQPCAIAASVSTVVCNNNGTPSNPSDDTYNFTLTVNNGQVGSYTTTVGNTTVTGVYGTPKIVGPIAITPAVLTLVIRDAVSSACATSVTVTPPATCSAAVDCNIIAVVSTPVCSDNGTTSDPSDDTFTFSVLVSNLGTTCGTGWFGGNAAGAYGVAKTFGPYLISSGNVFIGFQDNTTNTVTAGVTVAPPVTCSNVPLVCDAASVIALREWIGKVDVGTMTNTSGRSNYSDFSSTKIANVMKGVATTFSFSTTYTFYTFDQYYRAWIDYNRNNVFEANELVYEGINVRPNNGVATKALSGTFVVPAGATNGATKMRVSMSRGAYPEPCAGFARGEVEDYSVLISGMVIERNTESLSAEAESQLVSLYPNPAQSQVVVDLRDWFTYASQSDVPQEDAHVSVTLYDQIGKQVMKTDLLDANSGMIDLDLSTLVQGIYHVRIERAGYRTATKRLTISGKK
jgi:GEVED domain/Secretion system C-terminal sorting domain